VPDGDYVAVLESRLPKGAAALSPGPVMTTSGEIVGQHDGFARYTVGQRRRLPGGFAQPMYVVRISPDDRAVIIGTEDELYGHRVVLEEVNWLAPALTAGDTCQIQVRYRTRPVPARVRAAPEWDGGRLEIDLAEPVRAISPGQSGVLYRGSQLLGGGLIA